MGTYVKPGIGLQFTYATLDTLLFPCKCDLQSQNELKVARLYTKIRPVKHVTEQQKTNENHNKILIFVAQDKGLY